MINRADINSQQPLGETIFALATAPGRAGVSIMRISGPRAKSVCAQFLAGPKPKLPKPRAAGLRTLHDPQTGEPIDQALVLRFNGPASFTGEDMAELHLHGSPAIIEAISAALFSLGLRQARAGEFTRRAFENGRMDLTQAEGLADLIDAQTTAQRRQAYRQMDGGLRDIYEGWREGIMDALAAVEGEIDFPDEQDIPDKLALRAGESLDSLINALKKTLSNVHRGETIRHGLDIAIIGAPNAGKSSLLNALAKRDAAIVSETAGTTRDIVEVHMVMGGIPVRLSDTAGLRDTDDDIEAQGVARALKRADDADLRIGVVDASAAAAFDLGQHLRDGDMLALNKCDAFSGGAAAHNVSRETLQLHSISAKTGQGVEGLAAALEALVQERFGLRADIGLTRARHAACAKTCLEALERARTNLDLAPELAGEDLRRALHAIKELAGEADIEAVLGRIFSRFCVGK